MRYWITKMIFALAVIFNAAPAFAAECNVVDYKDPAYGMTVRQIVRPDGHEHNFYYHRNAFNANNTYMIGIRQTSDLASSFGVSLYTGDGCFIKTLFYNTQYDWRIVWDRINPLVLYTTRGSTLYKYNIRTQAFTPLKTFPSLGFNVSGPSLNQAGDRILHITSDGYIRTFHLPDMQDERVIDAKALLAKESCVTDWEDIRYTGYKNYVALNCWDSGKTTSKLIVMDDSGSVLNVFTGPYAYGYAGHFDFSPAGKLAYGIRGVQGKPFEIHVVNIDGTGDTLVYSIPQSEAVYIQNFHISWPDKVNNWFVVGLFPSGLYLPPAYAAPLDEIIKIYTSGTYRYLGRTGTTTKVPFNNFWVQPLPSPSADGSRLTFNSVCSDKGSLLSGCTDNKTIDQYIMFNP